MDFAGQSGVNPRLGRMVTNDILSAVTAVGYLNQNAPGGGTTFLPTDMLLVAYSDGNGGTITNEFSLSFGAGNIITLMLSSTEVALPTKANHIAVFTNTSGTLGEDAATAINGGNIQAGLSGTAGTLASFPGTASKGSFVVKAVANTGNTTTTLSNDAMGQATVVNIPDPANAVAQALIAATATPFTTGHLIASSGTAGLTVDSGIPTADVMQLNVSNTLVAPGRIIAAKVNGTEAGNAVTASGMSGVITTSSLTTAGGGTYAITWTNTLISSTSTVLFSIQGGTNTTQNITFECIPGSGTATLTIYNNTAATALNGTIFIGYLVI